MKKLIIASLLMTQTTAFANSSRDLNFSGSCAASNNATVSFVGDILIHKAIYESVANGSKDFTQIWRSTNSMIQKADFSVGNLEGPTALGIDANGKFRGDIGFVYDGTVYSGTNFVFNFHPRIANDLKNSGYDLISFANNHSLDRQSIGVDKTLENLRNAGLQTAGARTSYEGTENYYSISSVRGINIAFLACTEALNGRIDRKKQILNCYNGETESMIRSLSTNPRVDFIVVMPHWGVEYQSAPNQKQRIYAKKYAELGAGAVIGSHPHVIQPWEKYVNSKGQESLFVYSLGNFVAWQSGVNKKTGPIIYLNLTQSGNQKAQIAKVGYSLTQRQGVSVLPVNSQDKEYIRNAADYYGSKNFVLPGESLSKVLCK